jgi:hypothetical protein
MILEMVNPRARVVIRRAKLAKMPLLQGASFVVEIESKTMSLKPATVLLDMVLQYNNISDFVYMLNEYMQLHKCNFFFTKKEA